jgi:hypothetical protein
MTTSALSPEVDKNAATIATLNEQAEMKEIGEWVKQQYTKAKQARTQIERQWYLNMAFYQGRQWVTYMNSGQGIGVAGKLVVPPAPPYRVRMVINRIRSIVRTELSRMISNKPNASVVPASSEDEDLFAAQAGEQVWESIYWTHDLKTVFKRCAFWMSTCGTGYVKVWWDKDAKCKSGDDTVVGDIKYAPVTPFHIYVPDLTEEEIENQQWVINAYTKPVSWVNQMYGEDFKATVVASNEIVENGFLNLQNASANAQPDSCLVLEMWLKAGASKYFPDGGFVTVVDNRVVSIKKEMFFDHQQFPFIKFDNVPTGAYYAASVLEDVIPIQRELNRTRSQVLEAKNRMAKPQLLAAKGSIDPAKITSEPGIVIQYRPGLPPPSPLPLQPLPNYVLEEMNRSVSDIEDIASQHAVSKGMAPPGIRAATAIAYLQERDDSVLATTFQGIESGWEKIAKQTLSLVVQFWDTERIVQITGVDGSFDSIALKGAKIARGTDIRMEAGSALPISKAARQSLLMDMMTQGIIPPQQGLKLMEVGGVNKLYEELAVDERQAQRENLRMRSLTIDDIMQHLAQANESLQVADENPDDGPAGNDMQTGEPLLAAPNIIPVNTWDNHQTHIEVHNRFRKGQAFELLPDEIKQQFEAHVQAHATALNQAANQAAANGMPPGPGMAPGGPPPGGPPPPNGGEGNAPVGTNQFSPPPGGMAPGPSQPQH